MRHSGTTLRRSAAALLVAAIASSRSAAGASPEPAQDDPRARQFFAIGVQAYGNGQYLMAIEAFEQAYAVVRRPGLLFSLAQAHQRQFRLGADEEHLRAALDFYRKYLAADATGARRGEALAAIQALVKVAAQLHPNGTTGASNSSFGKLLIASPTPGVVVTLNGDRVEALPASLELPESVYTVAASAPGYRPERRELRVSAGLAVPMNFELQPLPAQLVMQGPAGAEAFVDGRPIGFLPVPTLSLTAGPHWLSVRQPGRRTSNLRLELARGESTRVPVELETTTQRRAAWAVGVGGAVSLVATGVFTGLAWQRDSRAGNLDELRQRTRDQAEQQNAAVDDRNRFRSYAIGGGLCSAALFGLALVLYFSDTPDPPRLPEQRLEPLARGRRFGVASGGLGSGSLLVHF